MLTLSFATAADWRPIAPLPVPNGGFAAGAVNGKVIIAGGTTWKDGVKVWLDEVWAYDAAVNRWDPKGRLPRPLAYGVCAESRDALLIAGGFDGTSGRTEVLRIRENHEVGTLTNRLLYPACLAVGGILEGQPSRGLFIFGGSPDPAKLDAVLLTGQRVGLGKDGAEIDTPHFFIAASAVCGGALHVFGGARAASPTTVTNLAAAWVCRSGEWKPLAPLPVALRGVTALRLDDTHLYLAGGYGGDPEGFRSDAWIYDTVRNTYTPAKPLPIAAMVGLVSDGTHVYCLGGEDAMKHRTDQCWRIPLLALLEQK